jgi:hypothetical protein
LNPGRFKELYEEHLQPDVDFLFTNPKPISDDWNLNEPKESKSREVYYEATKVSEDTVGDMLPTVIIFF